MTYYLGIASSAMGDLGHDPSACLIKNNKIVAMAEEERFVRVKHAKGYFPVNAVKYCLKHENISLDDVKIGYYLNPKLFTKGRKTLSLLIGAWRMNDYVKRMPKNFKFHFGIEPKINFIEHHVCHVYSSFPLSGFKRAVTVSMDGAGERTSTLITSCGSNIEKDREIYAPNSLGFFYALFTEWLGFRKFNGEGKVMGLASYGDPKYDLSKFIGFKDGAHHVKIPNRFFSTETWNLWSYHKEIQKKFGPRRTGKIQKIHEDVAASVQNKLEEVVLKMLEKIETKNLCLAGGVALNCKMNGRILESDFVKDIFIQPVANDAGCSLGAAVYMAMQDGKKFKKMEHTCLGPEFSNDEIKTILKTCKIEYEYHNDIAGIAAELLAKGKIIGWFQGRMECGPRALGNRSILADPRDPDMKDKINYLVKHREPWRPFCPSILAEANDEYFENAYESPFMILTFRVKKEKLKEIPSVVHVDETVRPQTVEKNINPLYYKLIKNFYEETNIPLILNTSFNIRGEPIVCKPEDAIRTFYGTGMDYLILGNFLIRKKGM